MTAPAFRRPSRCTGGCRGFRRTGRVVVDHLEEPERAAAILNLRLPLGVRRVAAQAGRRLRTRVEPCEMEPPTQELRRARHGIVLRSEVGCGSRSAGHRSRRSSPPAHRPDSSSAASSRPSPPQQPPRRSDGRFPEDRPEAARPRPRPGGTPTGFPLDSILEPEGVRPVDTASSVPKVSKSRRGRCVEPSGGRR
jgi:hypothetical protein